MEMGSLLNSMTFTRMRNLNSLRFRSRRVRSYLLLGRGRPEKIYSYSLLENGDWESNGA